MCLYTGCAPDDVCPRGAVNEGGRCIPEQVDVSFPALESDTRVTLVDLGGQGSDTTSNMDGSNAETDTTSASDADISIEADRDSSNTTGEEDISRGEDTEEMSTDGTDSSMDAESTEDGS